MRRSGTKSSKSEADSGSWGENPHAPAKGSVGNTERSGSESQARSAHDENSGEGTMKLMEEVLRNETILAAYKRVKKNNGAAGVDGMEVDELEAYCRTHWREIREELRNGDYMPQPVLKVEIPKPGGTGTRMLGIPTVFS